MYPKGTGTTPQQNGWQRPAAQQNALDAQMTEFVESVKSDPAELAKYEAAQAAFLAGGGQETDFDWFILSFPKL
jgi:hypothetical protein